MNIWLYTILTFVNGSLVFAWLIFLKRFGGN
jgi:hypothetical protein